MFEGYYADTCAEKFPLTSMADERSVQCVRTRERGPAQRQRNFFWYATIKELKYNFMEKILYVAPCKVSELSSRTTKFLKITPIKSSPKIYFCLKSDSYCD